MTAEYISDKYSESFEFLQARKKRQVAQLVLLNNLQRGDQNIASTLLLTLFNRVLSSLYDDKMQVKFLPSQGIMQEQINAYNSLAQSDYQEMDKARLDYDWAWDSLFFGRGYMETMRFDKKRKIMQPHVINPLQMGYDPYFDDPQQWRYYWKWLTKSKWELDKLLKAGVLKNIKSINELPTGVDTTLWEHKRTRDAAKEGIAPATDTQAGEVYQILEFFGYDKEGNKTVYWTDKNRSKIIFEDKLDLKDGEEFIAPDGTVIETGSRWPIVVKEAYREPHSSITFSIADLLEDKHRAKSVLLNLAYIAAKDRANPIYGYNPDKVHDVSQFFSRQINQHIPMDDADGVWPLNTQDPMSGGLIEFISLLTQEANEPVGTGQALAPEIGGQETATEVAITQQLNDMAQSLQSKVMQFGEQEFWSHWWHRYALNADELGSKMANIVGVKGIETEEIDLKLFNTDFPPGVFVYSAKEAEFKELVLRRDLMQLYPQLAASLDADGLRNFNKHIFFPKFLDDPSLIEVMLPDSLDEIQAEAENEILAKDEYIDAKESDNHTTHIYTHRMVQPKTNAVWIHIAEHEEMLARQKQQAIMEGGVQEQVEPQKPQVNQERRDPVAAASPLKTETQSSGTQNKQIR
jgi:hypothetical protein